MLLKDSQYKTGDWVRFLAQGKLVIGQVQYIREHDSLSYKIELVTDQGTVLHDSVLEARSAEK